MRPPIPILRSFDEQKAREFWVDFLGRVSLEGDPFGNRVTFYTPLKRA